MRGSKSHLQFEPIRTNISVNKNKIETNDVCFRIYDEKWQERNTFVGPYLRGENMMLICEAVGGKEEDLENNLLNIITQTPVVSYHLSGALQYKSPINIHKKK